MGLLDFNMPGMDTPQGQGLLAAAFSLMGAKGNSMSEAVGDAGQKYMGVYQNARSLEDQKKLRDLQMEQARFQMDQLKKAEEQRKRIAAGMPQFIKPGQAAVPAFEPLPGSPLVPMPARPAVAPSIDANGMAAFLAQNEDYKGALDILEKFKPAPVKLKNVEQMKEPGTGRMVNVAVYEDGQTKVLPFGVKPDIQIVGLGDRQEVVDKNSVTPGSSFKVGQSPDSRATERLGWANYSVSKANSDRAAAEANKPQLVDGNWVYRPDAKNPQGFTVPVAGLPEKPMTDSQSKANLFGTRALEAEKAFIKASGGDKGAFGGGADRPGWLKRTTQATVGLVPFAGDKLSDVAGSVLNWTQSDNQQMAEQAQDDFLNAIMRRESGAVIGRDEKANAARQYFPQVGDSPAVLLQKAKNRQVAIKAVLAEVPASQRPSVGSLDGWGIEKVGN